MNYIPKYSRKRQKKRQDKQNDFVFIYEEKKKGDLVFGKWLVFKHEKELHEK